MKKANTLILFICTILFTANVNARSVKLNNNPTVSVSSLNAKRVYESIDFGTNKPSLAMFTIAYNGYKKLMKQGKISKPILSIVDFEQSSNNDRLWVINLAEKSVIFNTLVAHGRNSGNEFATSFSNVNSSYKSSLGFYVTGQIYTGKHGKSLKLLGLEKGINDAAYNRGIVIHGADYVSKSFSKSYGRIGRSLGCPAVPKEICSDLIKVIANGSCLFIYKNDKNYMASSTYMMQQTTQALNLIK